MQNHDPLDTASQAKRKEDGEKLAQLARQQENDDLLFVMSAPQGRRFIWGLLGRAGVFRSTFNTNALGMAFGEGSRNEGLKLFNHIHEVCPELYLLMTKEQKKDA